MNDQFAKIAEGFHIDSSRGLVSPEPLPILPKRVPLSTDAKGVFTPYKKLSSKTELEDEIKRLRCQYAPFMHNYAPIAEQLERKILITDFIFTDHLGIKTAVKIPHYGGPIGSGQVSYESEFELEDFSDNCVYICFKGVDYISDVFINDIYVGSHEGFFAPFDLNITKAAKAGKNILKVIVKNDFTQKDGGDKIYAATGLGWDDSELGWHHCPPGMGIYNTVSVEVRSNQHITDVFPRFSSESGEFWVECNSEDYDALSVEIRLSVYGKNFKETITKDWSYIPSTKLEVGISDTFTETKMLAEGRLGKTEPLKLGKGFNRFIIPFQIKSPKIWSPETPYLYTVTVQLVVDGKVTSVKSRSFGIRSFTQDINSVPKGKFYLNGEEIKLFGANTMGFEQQDVMKGDFEQLIDDILLAKICNMNFLRITQRPVQEEVYDYCDMLGLMVQTDLPLFGVIRINKLNDVLKQVSEMERLIRSHPCCILDSYINEPFPNANNMPHRMLNRKQLEAFFHMADTLVHMENPDRVIKHVDGDYDPPNELLPDNHCYTMWYNGHAMDAGMLHKGYWLGIKPGWHCGCGEFGAEGLEEISVMKKYYPKEWLQEPFDPGRIRSAQTADFHGFFYETPKSIEEWVEDSQNHQSFAAEIMTSALRRNPYINTFALHLFIDAFPSGWMKTIMDCDRNPKKAFFTYMDCLSPIFCNLRSDRFAFWDNEEISIEAYLCNETKVEIDTIRYFVTYQNKVIASAVTNAESGISQGKLSFMPPRVTQRDKVQVYMGAFSNDQLLHYAKAEYTIFPYEELKMPVFASYDEYEKKRQEYDKSVRNGASLFVSRMTQGQYQIVGKEIVVTDCQMNPVYTVSRDTGHPWTKGLKKNDFAYCYDSKKDRLAPLFYATFDAEGITPVLLGSNRVKSDTFAPCYVCGTYAVGNGKVVICQLDLENKEKNPVVVKFLNNITEEL